MISFNCSDKSGKECRPSNLFDLCTDPKLYRDATCAVRYHMDEDPKCIKVMKIPFLDAKGVPVHYDRLAVSPDNQILAVTHGSTLQWLRTETGEILDTAENAHDGAHPFLVLEPYCSLGKAYQLSIIRVMSP